MMIGFLGSTEFVGRETDAVNLYLTAQLTYV